MNSDKKELAVSEKKAVQSTNGEPTRQGPTFVPHVDILEEPEAITLRADLPGVTRDRVDIDVREDVLTLTATVDSPADNTRLLYREYDIGGFSRRFTLGHRIDRSKISATMSDGVLTLVLPKAEEHKPRKIEVK